MDRILVVDDAELNRELLYDILKDNYIIETAEDGAEALEKLRKYRGGISALLLDLRMPKLDGFAVIEQMRQNGWIKHIPVLIISSEHAIEIENLCFHLGISDFIHKPFESSIVLNRVKNDGRTAGIDSEKAGHDYPDAGKTVTGRKGFQASHDGIQLGNP